MPPPLCQPLPRSSGLSQPFAPHRPRSPSPRPFPPLPPPPPPVLPSRLVPSLREKREALLAPGVATRLCVLPRRPRPSSGIFLHLASPARPWRFWRVPRVSSVLSIFHSSLAPASPPSDLHPSNLRKGRAEAAVPDGGQPRTCPVPTHSDPTRLCPAPNSCPEPRPSCLLLGF